MVLIRSPSYRILIQLAIRCQLWKIDTKHVSWEIYPVVNTPKYPIQNVLQKSTGCDGFKCYGDKRKISNGKSLQYDSGNCILMLLGSHWLGIWMQFYLTSHTENLLTAIRYSLGISLGIMHVAIKLEQSVCRPSPHHAWPQQRKFLHALNISSLVHELVSSVICVKLVYVLVHWFSPVHKLVTTQVLDTMSCHLDHRKHGKYCVKVRYGSGWEGCGVGVATAKVRIIWIAEAMTSTNI